MKGFLVIRLYIIYMYILMLVAPHDFVSSEEVYQIIRNLGKERDFFVDFVTKHKTRLFFIKRFVWLFRRVIIYTKSL